MRKAASVCKHFRVTHAAERGLPIKPLDPLGRDVLDEGVGALPCRNAGGSTATAVQVRGGCAGMAQEGASLGLLGGPGCAEWAPTVMARKLR